MAPGGTRAHGAGARAARRAGRSVAHLLRARPRPHPARAGVPAPGRQDPGLHLPRRPPAHPPHPRPRGRPGGRRRSAASLPAQRAPSPRPSPWVTTAATARAATPARTPSRRTCAGGYDHAVWGADVVLAPLNLCAETLDGDPQPLLVAAGARHARGRGGGLGRPHRLRLPRLRRRRSHAGIVAPDDAARPRPRPGAASAAASSSPPSSAAWSTPPRATGAVAMTPSRCRGARRRSGTFNYDAHLPAPGVGGPGEAGHRPAARRSSSTTPTPASSPTNSRPVGPAVQITGDRAVLGRALRAAVTYVGGHDRPLRVPAGPAPARLVARPAARGVDLTGTTRPARATRPGWPTSRAGERSSSTRNGARGLRPSRRCVGEWLSQAGTTSTSLRPLRWPNLTCRRSGRTACRRRPGRRSRRDGCGCRAGAR